MRMLESWRYGAFCGTLAMVLAACATPDPPYVHPATPEALLAQMRPVTSAMLQEPSPGDWLQWGRTNNGQNFSSLDRINRDNVKQLAPAWRTPIQAGLSMPIPLVHDGVMFLHTAPDTVLALDATTGAELWRHAYAVTGGIVSTQKMGLGLGGGTVFAPTSDLHVIALDARTGQKTWDHEIALSAPATSRTVFNLRSPPLVAGDKVIQGVTASAGPGGGFVVAIDIATGKEAWRFHTTARPDGPGGNTWNDLPIDKRTGGSVWDKLTYDPELNLIYFSSGPTYDTAPLLKASNKPGVTNDALYTNATVALDATTGRLKWYYQHMPNDQWDLDWAFERQIATVKVNGRNRKVVMNVGKMGVLDALDAATGAYLFSIDSGTQNIITAIDPVTGKKTIDPQRLPDPARSATYCPSPSGARAWPPTSYNPGSSMLFLPLTEWCSTMGNQGSPLLSAPGARLTNAEHPDAVADGKMGRLQAMDISGGKLAWRHDLDAPISTSALATDGGLVFVGDLDPALKAFDDRDGKLLWSAPLDANASSSIITYSVGSKQYVAVVTGMGNYHVGAMAGRYREFRKGQNLPAVVAATGAPSIQVFALP